MLKKIDRILLAISNMMAYAAAVATLLIILLVVSSASMRYLFRTPFNFSEELVGLLFLLSSVLTLPYVAAHKHSIRIMFAANLLPKRWSFLGEIFDYIIILVFSLWFGLASLEYCISTAELGSRSEQADFLLWPWIAALPASSFMLFLVAFVHLLLVMRQGSAGDQHQLSESL
jgi:TRAP-type C4-dicarboxylate transport system permease small subunit